MLLKDLLKDIVDIDVLNKYQDIEIRSVCCDTRNIEEDSMFIALKGSKYDGADYSLEAVAKGASVVVMNKSTMPSKTFDSGCYVYVDDTNKILKIVAERFYDNPSKRIKTIGITGTNGKTTISYLIESILTASGKKCGVIGTINYRFAGKEMPAVNTTPGILDNQKLLSEMVEEKLDYCIMEVSSHALSQGRVDLINFHAAVFTNLTNEHLDYHITKENYFEAKAKLFQGLLSDKTSAVNIDDEFGEKLVLMTQSRVLTYGIEHNADLRAIDIKLGQDKTRFKIKYELMDIPIRTSLIGMHNVQNILAAAAICLSEGVSSAAVKQGIENLKVVPGRLEKIDYGQGFDVFIDYAHTQDALERVLDSLKIINGSRLIVVFGCGGDRDRQKRSEMGEVASRCADFSIITTDNPRGEDPKAIVHQILNGFKGDNYIVEIDRKEAIKKALKMAEPGDIVLLAGKGHELYQIVKNQKIEFDEHKIISELLYDNNK
ncbi:MAG: UDP-N-acetylmuramoyl-L-alanyl-D-glutamate--2,6-diaminopimelate ligase [Omnitrophica WOR_2 bacterium RIFOXYB2_FULL_38_16]|nr:MAG: UDP-N-acetylmuramoyl-L-alanyl-D-glutamate--2,6-diaminopimelate ligase [Omnitrophica WOR_2 bacterium RIFOXYA2_FULL_38_17]OGX60459.1 MAG: UDP-N-acetylmuramoyl-L-alanyl-D-glutamate--2,6-diaminopimelate ligase [Omnitrophica WOR_2 bacterium RIFOXYB2_FULL_38_16]HBG60863.1 UDP-N-acetylmuramoyl-L-alanyl-D-glutamate--2,6-diaminopimelate ligase [Candidatus Omnitrophota bacterium]